MSVTAQSTQTQTPANGSTVTITKPTGLSVGDLMVAHIGLVATGGTGSIDLVSGWTNVYVNSVGNYNTRIMYKVADSSDVATTNFAFTGGGTSPQSGGGLYRITGQSTILLVESSNSHAYNDPTNIDVDAHVTPSRANSLLLMLSGYLLGTGAGTFSGQAIAVSNPSWTEDYDIRYSSNAICSMFGAHASRPEITSTGNASFTVSGSVSGNNGLVTMVVIAPPAPTTVVGVAGHLIFTGGTQVIKFGVKVLINAAHLVFTGGLQVLKRTLNWGNQSKNTSSWSDQSKNSTSWTNQSKNPTTWVDEDKTDE